MSFATFRTLASSAQAAFARLALPAAALLALAMPVGAAEPLPTAGEVDALIAKAQGWLLEQQQASGSFIPGKEFVVGLTGLAVAALVQTPGGVAADDPHIVKALALLKTYRQKDGGFYDRAEGLGDYGTSLTMLALLATHSEDAATITAAQNYLFGIQNHDPKDTAVGGLGYGDDKPGDENVETTVIGVQALRASGVPASDPHLLAALKFLERCQNLSAVNDQPWAKNGSSDGGAAYSPKESHAGGSWASDADKKAGAEQAAKGVLNSYGSMTYALISAYLSLDLKPEDPRVAAACGWVKGHYRFDGNPGMSKALERQGLIYYHGIMSRTFGLLGTKGFQTSDGKDVDWRADLFAVIKASAIPAKVGGDAAGGMIWMNSEKRWGEGVPHIATTYMLQALKRIRAAL